MAMGKHARQEKRVPSFYVMVTALIFIAFCLVTVWVFGSPSEESVEQTSVVPTDSESVKKNQSENQPFDDSTGDLTQDSEEKLDDSALADAGTAGSKFSEPVSTRADPSRSTGSQLIKDEHTQNLSDESKNEDRVSEEVETKTGGKDRLEIGDGDREDKSQSEVDKSDSVDGKQDGELAKDSKGLELPTGGEQSEIKVENKENAGSWVTQASESKEEKKIASKEDSEDLEEEQKDNEQPLKEVVSPVKTSEEGKGFEQFSEDRSSQAEDSINWEICSGIDFIPCLDNVQAIKQLHSTKHYEHRERHCPEYSLTCLVPIPEGYRQPIPWPQSRNEVWYNNVPHTGLVSYKKDQNWVKKKEDRLVFPGGGTQFKHGALNYINFIEKTLQDIAWGKRTRIILDVGCGVASFGGYLFDKDVLTMSFAPKDEHEAQVQLALERGIPAISAVMGTKRLVFPSNVYDVVHCARCRVPWHIEGGKLLLELNRVLRPGGYFVWSATPVYWKGEEDVSIWNDMVALTTAMCWNLLARTTDMKTRVGVAIFQKPTSNFCYEHRKKNGPPICEEGDKPDAAWYVDMTACIHKIPTGEGARGVEWPVDWPQRLETAPAWLSNETGLYGKPAAADFRTDTEHWQRVVERSYLKGLGIDWSRIRNVMDMKAVYGGFGAALAAQPVWVMNVVPVDAPDTLPVIFDRGLLGIYHDWCESFSTYPRTYDLLHADHLFSKLKKRCGGIRGTVVEVDRILRPFGWLIVRDKSDVLDEVEGILKSLHWDVRLTYSEDKEGLLAVQKRMWRPEATS